jgi:hypothetical protein
MPHDNEFQGHTISWRIMAFSLTGTWLVSPVTPSCPSLGPLTCAVAMGQTTPGLGTLIYSRARLRLVDKGPLALTLQRLTIQLLMLTPLGHSFQISN